VAAVIGVLWLGCRWFGPPAGLVAALLFATSPWAIFAARHIWQPDLLPPLAVLLLVALDLGVIERRVWWAAAALPIAAFGVLVHPAFALIAPLAVASVVVLVTWRRIIPLAAGGAVSALIVAPFALHEFQTRWVDLPNYRYYSSLNTFVNLDSVRYSLVLASGFGAPNDADVPRLDMVLPEWLGSIAAVLEIALLGIGVLAVLFVLAGWRRISREVRLRGAALVLWLALPIVLTVRHSFPVQAHYLLEVYPAPFLFIGAAYLWAAFRLVVQRTLLAAVIAVAGVQGFGVLRLIQTLPSIDNTCYGPSLQAASAVAQSVLDLTSQAQSQHAAVELDAGDALSAAYLVRGAVPEVDMVGIGSFGVHESAPPPAASMSGIRDPLAERGPHDLRYDNGVQLLRVAYATQPEPDQRVHLAIVWNVGDSAPPNRPLVWDITLHDSAGRVPYDQSGVDHVPASIDRKTIVSWFSIQPPEAPEPALAPGGYMVQVQLVDAFNSAPVPFTDVQGGSGNTWTIGPVFVGPRATCS
jgi:4-amino-4-deoxy-L-arabinose transferase-like glycosyltransferase